MVLEATGIIGGAAQANDRICMQTRTRKNQALAIFASGLRLQHEALVTNTFFPLHDICDGGSQLYITVPRICAFGSKVVRSGLRSGA